MEEKDLKALQDLIKNEVKNLSEAQKAFETASELKREELASKMAKYDENIQKLSTQADAIQLAQKDQTRMGQKVDPFGEMKKTMTDKAVIEELKHGGQRTFELKTSTIDLATELSGGTTDRSAAVVSPYFEPGVVKAPDRMVRLLDVIQRGNINSNRIAWVERTARTLVETNAVNAVSEGGAFIQADFTWATKFLPVEKIGKYVKCTSETLEDWDQLLSQIQGELVPALERGLENEVYSGTGTSPQMKGITTVCAAYTATAISGIVSPNLVDAIRAAVAQIRAANFDGQLTAMINPYDAAMMDMPKNSEGIYLMPPMLDSGRRTVGGCRVIESNLVTAGYMLVGDFSRNALFTKRGIEIKIWDQEASDAIYDLKTITASVRAVNRIALPDYDAFVYDAIGDIVTAISA
jgi:HK97 family phage major capsid protein